MRGRIRSSAFALGLSAALAWSWPGHAFDMRLQRVLSGIISVDFWDLTSSPKADREVEFAMLAVPPFPKGSAFATMERYMATCGWGYITPVANWKAYGRDGTAWPTEPGGYDNGPAFPFPGSSEAKIVEQACGAGPTSLVASARSIQEALDIAEAVNSSRPPFLPVPPPERSPGFKEVDWRSSLGLVRQEGPAALFIDWSRINRADSTARALSLVVLAKSADKGVAVLMRARQYDCGARTISTLAVDAWDQNGRKAWTYVPKEQASPVVAVDLDEAELTAVCGAQRPEVLYGSVSDALEATRAMYIALP